MRARATKRRLDLGRSREVWCEQAYASGEAGRLSMILGGAIVSWGPIHFLVAVHVSTCGCGSKPPSPCKPTEAFVVLRSIKKKGGRFRAHIAESTIHAAARRVLGKVPKSLSHKWMRENFFLFPFASRFFFPAAHVEKEIKKCVILP